jgi:Catalytic LigB subunit of aromatic ring-opening dioxygenase
MAKIVLGMGTSHGPMLSTPPEGWGLRVPDDLRMDHHYQGRTWSYDELVSQRRDENLEAQITLDVWKRRHAQCRSAIATLAEVFADAKIDVAVLVGNDQMECFNDTLVPAFSVLYGDQIINSEMSADRIAKLPPGIEVAIRGRTPEGGAVYPAQADLGKHIITHVMNDGFDPAAMRHLPGDQTPHAFGFVYRQIMNDKVVPSVPVFINTFYPPNQPTIRRCYDFGKSLVRAIESWQSDARVALIATGGLTHFVIDEQVDQLFFDALRAGDISKIADLGEAIFQDGTSEMKNWVPVAGAMAALGWEPQLVDYVPCYRTTAGTGNAMAFVYWQG